MDLAADYDWWMLAVAEAVAAVTVAVAVAEVATVMNDRKGCFITAVRAGCFRGDDATGAAEGAVGFN